MRLEKTEIGWLVHVAPNELQCDRRPLPYATCIGLVNPKGTLKVWTPAASKPQGYPRAAKYMLEAAREQLFESGALRNVKKEKARKEEIGTGSFIVQLSSGERSRFHEYRRASDWAESMLREHGPGTKARISRPGGITATVLEKNEYGHIKHADIQGRKTLVRG